jgi:hypothetical protein
LRLAGRLVVGRGRLGVTGVCGAMLLFGHIWSGTRNMVG